MSHKTRYIKCLSVLLGVFLLLANTIPNTNLQAGKNEHIYVLDTAKSKVLWTNYHKGFVKFKEGSLVISSLKNQLKEAAFTIDMHSIADLDIDNKLLNGTLVNVLKSLEFFNVKAFPEAKFELNSLTEQGENNFLIEGDFIIFKDALCHSFNGNIRFANDSLYFDTEPFFIDRTDWGMFYLSINNPNPKKEEESYVVSDSIRIETHIVAYKEK